MLKNTNTWKNTNDTDIALWIAIIRKLRQIIFKKYKHI